MLISILSFIDGTLYTYCLIYLLAGAGIYFTVRSRFVQVRLIKDALKNMLEKNNSSGMSPFQALMIATASRIGTGNMAGVATAIILGGPGAAFWMWIMAVIGSSSAFVESTLAQIYKKKDGDSFKGGPAYYIERALKARWLGIIFAVSLIATFGFGFNGLQAYSIVSSMDVYLADPDHSPLPLIIGGVLFVIMIILFFYNTEKIGWISSILVPLMSGMYILMSILIVLFNIGKVPSVLAQIFQSAFDFKAIFGGLAGSCMVYGVKRGLFSNEAGMGSAPNASAAANVSHPVKQGLAQIISVYIDTLLICTATVSIILLTGVNTGEIQDGIPLIQMAVKEQFGPFAVHIITVSVWLFAFTSMLGNYYYAESNVWFITKNKIVMAVFRILAAGMIFFGAQTNMEVAWSLADITMGVEAVINIIAIFLLSKIAFAALKDYEKQKKEGKNPVFKESDIGLDNTDVWK